MASTNAANKELVRRFVDDVWNEGNLDAIDEYLADEFVQHEPAMPEIHGPDGYRENVAEMMFAAFPDLTMTIEDSVAEGDTVVERVTVRGTHEGEFMGIEPTGNEFEVAGINIERIEEGKIVERWVQADVMGMMDQLGVQ